MKALPILGASLLLSCTVGCAQSGDLVVPVEVRNATNIGAITFELVYDLAVLDAIDVTVDELAEDSTAGYNASTPGRVLVVIENAQNIDGAGTLVAVHFEMLSDVGYTALTLENVAAKSLVTLQPVAADTEVGNFMADSGAVASPVITFLQ